MDHRLRKGLSYCRIDGHVIFLDILSDRYFRLSDSMEATFMSFAYGGRNTEAELAMLAKKNILTTEPRAEGNAAGLSIMLPTRSVFEQPGPSRSLSLPVLLEVVALVLATRRALRAHRLAYVIESLVRYRRKHTGNPPPQTTTLAPKIICNAAESFRCARLYLPVTMSCLLDSLALTKFLSRRQIAANIVFGVTRDPFAAHCWVQIGDMVLNDTVGNAVAHTPIRIV